MAGRGARATAPPQFSRWDQSCNHSAMKKQLNVKKESVLIGKSKQNSHAYLKHDIPFKNEKKEVGSQVLQ